MTACGNRESLATGNCKTGWTDYTDTPTVGLHRRVKIKKPDVAQQMNWREYMRVMHTNNTFYIPLNHAEDTTLVTEGYTDLTGRIVKGWAHAEMLPTCLDTMITSAFLKAHDFVSFRHEVHEVI